MRTLTALFILAGTPALAAGGGISLSNTNFVVFLAFVLFIAVLVYFKVPGMIGGQLDKRADAIKAELDEARALREEAQSLLASYQRKQQEVAEQSERIVAHAKEEAEIAGKQAQADLEASIARRLKAAEDQIASAEAGAVKEVRDKAISVAVAAAGEVIAKKMDASAGNKLIDDAIAQVESKLH